MSTKNMIIGALAISVVSAAGGYYLAPQKIKTEVKTVEVVKEVKVKDTTQKKDKNKKYVKTSTTKPDGTKTETVTVTEDDKTQTNTNSITNLDKDLSQTSTKEVTKSSGHTNISGMMGLNPYNLTGGFTYGLSVTKNILGPITAGAWGMTSGVGGISLGIDL